jgi:hypothetical protein
MHKVSSPDTFRMRFQYQMDPKQFAELEQKILGAISPHGGRFFETIRTVLRNHPHCGYSLRDVKAAILGLKASGKVQLDEDGTLRLV